MPKRQSIKSSRTISLQRQLLTRMALITLALGVIGVLIISISSMYSNNRIFDHLLAVNARVLLTDKNATSEIDAPLAYLNEEMDIEWQKWQSKGDSIGIIDGTFNAPTEPFVADFQEAVDDSVYYNVWYEQRLWRVMVLRESGMDAMRYIQIAQPWWQRFELALPTIFNYVAVMGAVMLSLLIGTILVIRQGMAPLSALQRALDDKNLGDLSMVRPVTVIKETEPLINTINNLLQRLERAYASQERFTADASHELRTPLAAISMKLQLLERRYKDTEGLAQALQPLRNDIARATVLTESLLMLARLDSGAQDPNLEPVAVSQLLNSAASQMQDKCQLADVTLTTIRLPALQNTQIIANKQLMLSALINLINNALLHASTAQIKVSQISLSAQTQSTQEEGVQLVLMVQDNGQGVPAHQRTQLTERFFRLSSDNKSGSGLGLSIVQKIAEHHGGSVQFTDGLTNPVGKQGFGVAVLLPLQAINK